MIIDTYSPSTAQALLTRFKGAAEAGNHLYALLDHSFDPKLISKMKENIAYSSLYRDHEGDIDISPILCHLRTGDELLAQIELLLLVSEGQPLLSFWLSPWDRESVFSHFEQYFDVTILPERLRFILRYADTRILPSLLRAFSPEQKSAFLGPFSLLAYFDRAANPVWIDTTKAQQIATEHLVLTEQQFNQVINASLPDQVLQRIEKLKLRAQLPAQASLAYEWARQHCSAAEQEGLFEFAEIMSYCSASLSSLNQPGDLS